jgi:SPP1 gp7 family putative phage head morphogenesis protein
MADLYDKLTRHQVYLERVKAWQGNDFNDTLDVLGRRVNGILLDQTKDLIDMTPTEYRNFTRRMSNQLDRTLKRSSEVLLSDFQKFSSVDNKLLRDILGSERTTRRRMPKDATVWNAARKRVLGANGLTLEQTMARYYASVKADVMNRLAQARVNGTSMRELRDEFSSKGKLLKKWKDQANSVIATSLQHISSVTQSYYEGIFFERYRWAAVLDDRTTDICRSRDGKTWRYGKGPLPPAHYNCRSKIVPVEDTRRNLPATYFAWLTDQPLAFLVDIVGKQKAERIKSGKATTTEFPKFMGAEPLPLDEFANKLTIILTD